MIYLFHDTETTGLKKKFSAPLSEQPSIVELAIILTDEGLNEIDTFDEMFDPKRPIEEGASKASGILDKDVEGKDSFADHYPRIREMFARADEFWAHNCDFDKDMMMFELARINKVLDFPEEFEQWRCSLAEAQSVFPHAESHKLELLHKEVCNPTTKQTHRALDDVRLMIDVVREIWKQ